MMDVDFLFWLTFANGSFGVEDTGKVSWPVSSAVDTTSPPAVCRTKEAGRALSCLGSDRGSHRVLSSGAQSSSGLKMNGAKEQLHGSDYNFSGR